MLGPRRSSAPYPSRLPRWIPIIAMTAIGRVKHFEVCVQKVCLKSTVWYFVQIVRIRCSQATPWRSLRVLQPGSEMRGTHCRTAGCSPPGPCVDPPAQTDWGGTGLLHSPPQRHPCSTCKQRENVSAVPLHQQVTWRTAVLIHGRPESGIPRSYSEAMEVIELHQG